MGAVQKASWETVGKSFPAYGCLGTIKDKCASQFFECFPSIHFCMADPAGDLNNQQGWKEVYMGRGVPNRAISPLRFIQWYKLWLRTLHPEPHTAVGDKVVLARAVCYVNDGWLYLCPGWDSLGMTCKDHMRWQIFSNNLFKERQNLWKAKMQLILNPFEATLALIWKKKKPW